jgi:hypothetical protein
MPASDYNEFKTYGTPADERMLFIRHTFGKLLKQLRRNAPAEPKSLGEDEIPVKIRQNEENGAELYIDRSDIGGGLPEGAVIVPYQKCQAGVPVTVYLIEVPAP